MNIDDPRPEDEHLIRRLTRDLIKALDGELDVDAGLADVTRRRLPRTVVEVLDDTLDVDAGLNQIMSLDAPPGRRGNPSAWRRPGPVEIHNEGVDHRVAPQEGVPDPDAAGPRPPRIRITGGQVSAGAAAAGDHAQATNISAVSAEPLAGARSKMRKLLGLLRARAEALEPLREYAEEPLREVIAVAELVDRELGKDEPDKGRILLFLDIVAAGPRLSPATSKAVFDVQQAVAGLP